MTDTVTNPKLAEVIEEARKRAGKTKFRLAVETRLSLGTVRLATQGIATTATLNRLAQVLGVTIDELTGRTARPSAPDAVLKATDAATRRGAR